MNEELLQQIASAVKAMTEIATAMQDSNTAMSARIERIVATVESAEELQTRIADLEKANAALKQQLEARPQAQPSHRKTLPPLVSALLAKQGVETDGAIEAGALEASLKSLPVEQRIAVKSQMHRAGLIG
jgi:phage I-like protein